VAWRNGKIAVAWLTKNYPLDPSLTGTDVIAYRLFVSSPLPGALKTMACGQNGHFLYQRHQ
jgi:hypothetical protein